MERKELERVAMERGRWQLLFDGLCSIDERIFIRLIEMSFCKANLVSWLLSIVNCAAVGSSRSVISLTPLRILPEPIFSTSSIRN